jgi:SAM-dependent methyltransferase
MSRIQTPFQAPLRAAGSKFEFVASHLRLLASQSAARPRLLDVGCRGCEFEPFVSDFADYEGLDLVQNARGSVRHVFDISRGLPFADRQFDYVVALDVLEHVDDLQGALEELLRITRVQLVVLLPNMAHAIHRWRFLIRGHINDKYDLVYGAGKDRHRWLPVLHQSDRYIQDFCSERGVVLDAVWFNDTPKKDLLARAGRRFGLKPALVVWCSFYFLSPKG